MKKILAMVAALSVIVSLAAGGTIAYLTDTTEVAENVMTVGNVSIDQKEDFESTKQLLPMQTVKKKVTVENTGASDAYVRTFVAFEKGRDNTWKEVINFARNTSDWTWQDSIFDITVDDVVYEVYVANYNEVLPATDPNTTTPASLESVSMIDTATNDDVAVFDEEYTVLVLSQAVQTAGFDSKTTYAENFAEAFATAFQGGADKPLTAAMIQGWFGGETEPEATPTPIPTPTPTPTPVTVSDPAELKTALTNGGNIVLNNDIELTSTLMAKKDVVIDLNGKTITAPSSGNMFQYQSNAEPSITITSSTAGAEINVTGGDTSVLLGYGSTVIKNVTINVTGCDNYSPNPFNVYGDLTLGEGTVVNVDYLGTALISNNGAIAIVIDGAKINIGTFKTNGTAIITLNNASTLEMKNTEMTIDEFVLSSFGGDSLVSKIDGVTIEDCTFNVTDSNGASCTFVAKNDKYRLVQN